MTILTSYTDFSVADALEQMEDSVDLVLLPELTSTAATRRLTYPGDLFPPLDYPDSPDKWTNFDTVPLTNRPQVKNEMALKEGVGSVWPGYKRDLPITERWEGADKIARMTTYFVRRFLEYFLNPPKEGFITWWPRDLTDKGYEIIIENFSVDGQNLVQFMKLAHWNELVTGVIEFTFRIVGEVEES